MARRRAGAPRRVCPRCGGWHYSWQEFSVCPTCRREQSSEGYLQALREHREARRSA